MINFLKYKRFYFLLSALIILPGLVSLVVFGLKPGIDFTGGSRWEIKLEREAATDAISRTINDAGVELSSIVPSGERRLLIKTKFIDEKKRVELKGEIGRVYGRVEELRFESVGPLLGRELLVKTMFALILATLLILIYIAWQFKNWEFGVCATLATLHDTLVLLGSFSLLGRYFGFEVDVLFVTAVLTILSFSVHDTIVVYDRIRESVKRFPGVSFDVLIDRAINETLVRSLNNSLAVIFMMLSLVLLGGETIRQFTVALLIGTVSGTYSSIFTAAPLLAILRSRTQK